MYQALLCMHSNCTSLLIFILQEISPTQLNDGLKAVFEAFRMRAEYLNCIKEQQARPPSGTVTQGQAPPGKRKTTTAMIAIIDDSNYKNNYNNTSNKLHFLGEQKIRPVSGSHPPGQRKNNDDHNNEQQQPCHQ